MAHTRERMKGRRTRRRFAMFFHDVFTSPEYAQLSPRAVKLLVDIAVQFNGSNNGDFSAAWSVMARLGWTSKDQLYKALAELERGGWIIKTRQGWNRAPNLYAVSWLGINSCGGKLDLPPDPVPKHLWRAAASALSAPRPTDRSAPPGGLKLVSK